MNNDLLFINNEWIMSMLVHMLVILQMLITTFWLTLEFSEVHETNEDDLI